MKLRSSMAKNAIPLKFGVVQLKIEGVLKVWVQISAPQQMVGECLSLDYLLGCRCLKIQFNGMSGQEDLQPEPVNSKPRTLSHCSDRAGS